MMSYVLGVDVGTTFTAAACWRRRDGRAEVVALGDRANAVPSVLLLRSDGTWLVGDAADRGAVAVPDRVAREFKRRVGDHVPVLVDGRPFAPQTLVGELLRQVVGQVNQQEGGSPERLLVTCPANWGEYRRGLLVEAVREAGLGEVTLLSEPVAAATWYASLERLRPGALVGVYDLGGGTFDAAVLRTTEAGGAGFELCGEPAGEEQLGGVDFDQAVMEHVAQTLGTRWSELDLAEPGVLGAVTQVRAAAVAAKEVLSSDLDVAIPVVLPGWTGQIRLTRAEFEASIRDQLERTVATFGRALDAAGVPAKQLHGVLLVGGSSRIPLVGELLIQRLGVRVALDAHPKFAVCQGAALAGAIELGVLTRHAAGAAIAGGAAAAAAAAPGPTRVTDHAKATDFSQVAEVTQGTDGADTTQATGPVAEPAGGPVPGRRGRRVPIWASAPAALRLVRRLPRRLLTAAAVTLVAMVAAVVLAVQVIPLGSVAREGSATTAPATTILGAVTGTTTPATPSSAPPSQPPSTVTGATTTQGSISETTTTAVGEPAIELSTRSLAFGTVTLGERRTLRATVRNSGTATLRLLSVALTGSAASDFSVSGCAGVAVRQGSSCRISVTFRPTAAASRSASLVIRHNAGAPITISLSGRGAQPPLSASVSTPAVSPSTYSGPCPVVLTFTATIRVNRGPAEVSFRWLRSDGATAPVQQLSFSGRGAQSRTVTTTWTLGGPGFHYSGWQAVALISPNSTQSGHANFSVDCALP